MAKKRILQYSGGSKDKPSQGHVHKPSDIPHSGIHHDVHHNAHNAPQRAAPGKVPSGIRILIGYSMLLAVFYLLYFLLGVYRPQLLFLSGTIISYSAIIVDAIFVAALVVLIYGFRKRRKWAWMLGLVWYSLSTLHSIASVYLTAPNLYNILRELLMLSSIFIVLINLLIIWYICTKRQYFHSPHYEEKPGKRDKIFAYSLVCFWAIMILLSTNIGFTFYKDTTKIAGDMVDELKDTTPLQAIAICETKDSKDRDICFVVLVTVFDKENLEPICSRIDSDLYRFSCMQVRG